MNPQRLQPAIDPSLLRPYTSHRPEAPIDLFLDANEGAAPPPEVIEALSRLGPETLRRYPSARSIESRIAGSLGLDAACVVFTAGGDDAIDRCCRAMLTQGNEVLLPVPTFEMIGRYARLRGADIIEVAWGRNRFPVDALLGRVSPRTRLIAVVTPNNPTGSIASARDVERLAKAAPHALILVDLAYTEFADEELTPAVLSWPNVVVIRTLSKAFGLAGLRAGYAVSANPDVIGWLRSVGNPYAASAITITLAANCLELGLTRVRPYLDRVRAERVELEALLASWGGRPYPSKGNFVLCEVDDAAAVHRALAADGIAVRAFPGSDHLDNCLRITCPGEERTFARLTAALRSALTA